MIRGVHDHVWAFDIEWAPDPRAGRLLLSLDPSVPDEQVMRAMWAAAGATDEDPMPYLKTVQCRIVSIAAMQRRVRNGNVELNLLWLPRDASDPEQRSEARIVQTFLQALGRFRPQLVGFNSRASDLKILIQRALVLGLRAPDFCRRPDKPWEGADYFARENEFNIDLMEILSAWGAKSSVSLHEAATLSGIPGKLDTSGEQVATLWLEGRFDKIVQYNCYDAITTYLLWLRMAHLAGHFTTEQYEEEQETVRQLMIRLAEAPEGAYLERYFDAWEHLQQRNTFPPQGSPG